MIQTEQHGPVTAIRMARAWLGKPLYWTAAYWVDGLLIDTGPRCTAQQLARVLEQVRVEQIVVTHGHEDHAGGLAMLRQRYPDVPVYASLRTLPFLERPARLQMQPYRRLIWGVPQAIDVENDHVRALDDLPTGQLETPDFHFRIIQTPGHTVDHISLFEPTRRWLFCGDAFIGGRETSWSTESNLFGVISSLRLMADLRPERLFPGSGTVRRVAGPDIHGKIDYLTRLCREVAKLEGAGLSVAQIASQVVEENPRLKRWTLGHFSAVNLVQACQDYNAIFASVDSPTHPSAGSTEDAPSANRSR